MKAEEIAKKLNIAVKTVYNWKEKRPELYEIIEIGLGIKKDNVNITITKEEKELNKLIQKLTKKEQELYIYEIKARILKKELDN